MPTNFVGNGTGVLFTVVPVQENQLTGHLYMCSVQHKAVALSLMHDIPVYYSLTSPGLVFEVS